jgi:hypothetical protein
MDSIRILENFAELADVRAAGVYLPTRQLLVRGRVELAEAFWRCLRDTFQVLKLHRQSSRLLRYRFENARLLAREEQGVVWALLVEPAIQESEWIRLEKMLLQAGDSATKVKGSKR